VLGSVSVHNGSRVVGGLALLALNDYGFFVAILFRDVVAMLMGIYLTFVIVARLAIGDDFLVIHLDAPFNGLWVATQIVNVLLNLLLLWALLHLTIAFFIVAAFILVNDSRYGLIDVLAGPVIS